jgi:hypothetical protein
MRKMESEVANLEEMVIPVLLLAWGEHGGYLQFTASHSH